MPVYWGVPPGLGPQTQSPAEISHPSTAELWRPLWTGRCVHLSLFGPNTSPLSLTEGPGWTPFWELMRCGTRDSRPCGDPGLIPHSQSLISLLVSALNSSVLVSFIGTEDSRRRCIPRSLSCTHHFSRRSQAVVSKAQGTTAGAHRQGVPSGTPETTEGNLTPICPLGKSTMILPGKGRRLQP